MFENGHKIHNLSNDQNNRIIKQIKGEGRYFWINQESSLDKIENQNLNIKMTNKNVKLQESYFLITILSIR